MLVTTAYLPPVSYIKSLASSNEILYIEACENYQKRSYRNRAYLSTANKIITLSVPLIGGKNDKQPIQSVQISYEEDWIKLHIDTIHAAYGKSAFFIHYIEELEAILQKKHTYLFELNNQLLKYLKKHLHLDNKIQWTDDYHSFKGQDLSKYKLDFPLRTKLDLATMEQKYYAQVFEDRYGFLPELTALDLLFCTGPEARIYL